MKILMGEMFCGANGTLYRRGREGLWCPFASSCWPSGRKGMLCLGGQVHLQDKTSPETCHWSCELKHTVYHISPAWPSVLLASLILGQKYFWLRYFCITSPVDSFKRLNYCLVMFCLNQAFHRFLLLCGQPADSQPGDADDVKVVSEVKTSS